jgi:hypothetical protein
MTDASTLEGAELDAAVARALGVHIDRYSTDWGLAGPIIERERFEIWPVDNEWAAGYRYGTRRGATPLIAAMRVFVVSKGKK